MDTNDTIELTEEQKMQAEIDDELGGTSAGIEAPDPEAGAAAAGDEAGDGTAAGDADAIDPELLRAVATDAPSIPKPRFDEATGKLKDTISGLQNDVESLRAYQAAAVATVGEPRDFEKERAELRERYNSFENEMELDDYLEARDKLTLEQGEYNVRVANAMAQAEAQRNTALKDWQSAIQSWADDNAEFLANGHRRKVVNDMLEEYSKDGTLSNADLIKKVQDEAFDAFSWSGKAPDTKPDAVVDPHAARNGRDAAAQSKAGSAGRVAADGMGDRGHNAEVDNSNLSYQAWKKLSPADQAKLLGEEE